MRNHGWCALTQIKENMLLAVTSTAHTINQIWNWSHMLSYVVSACPPSFLIVYFNYFTHSWQILCELIRLNFYLIFTSFFSLTVRFVSAVFCDQSVVTDESVVKQICQLKKYADLRIAFSVQYNPHRPFLSLFSGSGTGRWCPYFQSCVQSFD